jgi:uncharacterized protein (TIGR02145 family)
MPEANIEFGELFDKRDDSNYQTVRIGKRTWLAENLNTSFFLNGDQIPEARTFEDWQIASNKKQPAWSYYDNDSNNEKKYGKLYNWYAVADPRGLAPIGWRIPTKDDWDELELYTGDKEKAGLFLMSRYLWKEKQGIDMFGFTAIPGGILDYDLKCFMHDGTIGYWWTTSLNKPSWANETMVICRSISVNYDNLIEENIVKDRFAMSVRCLLV